MESLLAEVWILGLLSGLDPLAFIAVIVVSAQQRRNGLAFVSGWLLTLVVLCLAPVIFIHGHAERRGPPAHRHLKAWLFLILGVVLIVLALRAWQLGRRDRGDEVPKWYRRLQRVGPRSSFFAGLVLPSIPAAIAAGAAAFHTNLSLAGQLLALLVFLVVSSLNVVVPVAVLYLKPSAAPALARMNSWAFLRRHSITFVVLGLIGLGLIARSMFRLIHGF
jgi:hypothetical protein